MALTTAQKLKIKEGNIILIINAPSDYKKSVGTMPTNAKITDTGKTFDQIHWFVKDKTQMEKELKKVLPLIKNNVICWIFYPKGTSKIQTDLTRDKGWDELLKQDLQWISLISFDDTWSAFGMRQKTQTDEKKNDKPKERPILDYIDSSTKTVKLPNDVAAVLKNKKTLLDYFNSLAFSHKKEYIEWIISAKKEETRKQRIQKMTEMLKQKRKNPFNG
jgi:hypothetical protein